MGNYETLKQEIDSYPFFIWMDSYNTTICVIKGRTSALYRKLFGCIYYRKRLDIE